MGKILSKSNVYIIFMLVIAIAVPFVFSGCGRNVERLTLSLENNVTNVSPNSPYNLVLESNLGQFNEEVNYEVREGSEYVSIEGNTLTILSSAIPDTQISIIALYNSIRSNVLNLTITHIEATSLEISSESLDVMTGEMVSLSANYAPSNATRNIEYQVLTNNATVVNNMLVIDTNAKNGDTVQVQAKMGETQSNILAFNVSDFDSSAVVGLQFADNHIIDNNYVVDTTVQQGEITFLAQLYVLGANGRIAKVAHRDIEYSVENEDILRYNADNLSITPIASGETQITATYLDKSATINVIVNMVPLMIDVPENFKHNDVDYNYAQNQNIENFVPTYVQQNGCTDYALNVFNQNTLIARFEVIEGKVNEVQNGEFVDYDGNNLKVNGIIDYTFSFESISGCKYEVESDKITIHFNDGTNVSNKDELMSAITDNNTKKINFVSDVILSGGKESFTSYGDKEINGNGFKLDASEQILGLDEYDTEVPIFNFYPVDINTPYTVILRDLNIIGNYGYLSTQELLEIAKEKEPNITEQQLINDKNLDYFYKMTYRCAIWVHNDDVDNISADTVYSYAKINFKNLAINNFMTGIKLNYVMDEKSLTGSGSSAIEDISIGNLFGDGITFVGSQLNIDGFNCGIVGGSPLAMNGPEHAIHSGEYRNLDAYTRLTGTVRMDNNTDGSGLYLKYQMTRNEAIAAIYNLMKEGVSSMINTIISLIVTQTKQDYRDDKEMQQQINSTVTNIFTEEEINGSTKNLFNLLYFNAADAGDFIIDNQASLVSFSNEFCLNGVDTTHQYIEIGLYDTLSLIPAFSSIVSSLGDTLKPIKVIIMNQNYVAA